jgi:hypothetical protein
MGDFGGRTKEDNWYSKGLINIAHLYLQHAPFQSISTLFEAISVNFHFISAIPPPGPARPARRRRFGTKMGHVEAVLVIVEVCAYYTFTFDDIHF